MIENIGGETELNGIRSLERAGEEIHVITGNIDSKPEKSIILKRHPEGTMAKSSQYKFTIPRGNTQRIHATLVRIIVPDKNVEGLTIDHNKHPFYVHDEDKIRVRFE